VVPDILRSGDHGAISSWREQQRHLRTQQRRPDLYARWSDQQQASTLSMESPGSVSVQLRIGNESADPPEYW